MARRLTQRSAAHSLLPPLAVLFFLAWNTGYGLNSYRSLSNLQAGSSWQNGEVLMSRIAEQPLRPPEVHGDYDRQSYCAGRRPCVALLSTTNKAGIESSIDPKSLKSRGGVNYNAESSVNLRRRVLVRNAYCAAYHCDVIIDYNNYAANRTMWLSNQGGHEVGPMPPHWNKVASIKRWLDYGIYDAVIWLDMDAIYNDFSTNIYDIVDDTEGIRHPGNSGFVLFRHGDVSRCVVDNWWSFGTSPGCRYFEYPENHMGQEFSLHELTFDCLDQSNGPSSYVDHLMKSPDHDEVFPLWIGECYRNRHSQINESLGFIDSNSYGGKKLQYELQWGAQRSEVEAMNMSVSVHRKDSAFMKRWLSGMEELLLNLNCTPLHCFGVSDDVRLIKGVSQWWSAWSKLNAV